MPPSEHVESEPERRVGVVVIGRNEGERLARCLDSVIPQAARVVYVDSGSTDGSVELAGARGVDVVSLDSDVPFTAARARNTGFDQLARLVPDLPYVMFVDGDCEVRAGWLETAASTLDARPDRAVVFGRLRERFPDASIYNRLCDMEWDVPAGLCTACGGISVMRCDSFQTAGWFNATMIAGEEPELCVRLRRAGGKIEKLAAEMALHDAAMTRFSQWWKRSVRAGHAYAEGMALHGWSPERHCVHESRSIWFWGFLIPAMAIPPAWPTHGLSFLLLLGYPILLAKIALGRRRTHGEPWRWCLLYGAACVISKPAMLAGQLRYLLRRILGRRPRIIEHRS